METDTGPLEWARNGAVRATTRDSAESPVDQRIETGLEGRYVDAVAVTNGYQHERLGEHREMALHSVYGLLRWAGGVPKRVHFHQYLTIQGPIFPLGNMGASQ